MKTCVYLRYNQEPATPIFMSLHQRQTVQIASADVLNGNKLYLIRARKVLPYLVRQAKAGQTIYYSDLAKEVGIPNPRNLNYVLGAIGNALIQLSETSGIEIPPIQCLVVNKKDELPGEGIAGFILMEDFLQLNKTQRSKIVTALLLKIHTFQKWDWVLIKLSLEPLKTDLINELYKAKLLRGGGESEQHKFFKEYVSKNPELIGLHKGVKHGQLEYILPSCDTIDILFEDGMQRIAVEIKSNISDTPDILRGIFQCIKYKHLIEAEQIINNQLPDSRVMLVLQGQLPHKLISVKNLLGIEVIENVKKNPNNPKQQKRLNTHGPTQ
jgi:hypothetical protein